MLLGIIGFLCVSSIVIGAIVFFLGIGVVGYLLVYNYERFFKKCGYIAEDDGKIKNDDYDFEVEVDYDELHRQEAEAQQAETGAAGETAEQQSESGAAGEAAEQQSESEENAETQE